MDALYLIVGLGNPGPQYARNRHNVGFQVLDRLAGRHGLTFSRTMHRALVAEGRIDGRRVLLAKPLTYMNNSGEAVGALVRSFDIPLEQVLVVYDDIDLPPGALRLRPKGGSGGQRGMRSIIHHLGTEAFPRLRIGIGRPPERMDVAAYVLQNFSPDEELDMEEVRERAVDAIETWLREGLQAAMNRFNT
nr:aminoacyl-tRNA hydrolase [Ardenticatena sp.]